MSDRLGPCGERATLHSGLSYASIWCDQLAGHSSKHTATVAAHPSEVTDVQSCTGDEWLITFRWTESTTTTSTTA